MAIQCRARLFSRGALLLLALNTIACSSLNNSYDPITLHCGTGFDQAELAAIYQFQSPAGDTLDLNVHGFQLVDNEGQDFDQGSYSLSSKGCLGLRLVNKFHFNIPNTGLHLENLGQGSGFQLMTLRLDSTRPVLNIVEEREVFPAGAVFPVLLEPANRARYCIEAQNKAVCNVSENLSRSFHSAEYRPVHAGEISLPTEDGSYLIHILAQNRAGNFRLVTRAFEIDNAIPEIALDTLRISQIIYHDDEIYNYVPAGYRVNFRATATPLAALKIEYCFKSIDENSANCSDENIHVFGDPNPPQLEKGRWMLQYRAKSRAGIESLGGWVRTRMLVGVVCDEEVLSGDAQDFYEKACTELNGDIDVGAVPLDNWPLLERLVGVSGEIRMAESFEISIFPEFASLHFTDSIYLTATEFERLEAFPNVLELNSLVLHSTNIRELIGFNKLKRLDSLKLVYNRNLDIVLAFRSLEEINDELNLTSNTEISNLDFFSSLQRVGKLTFLSNHSLSDIMGLRSLHLVNQIDIQYSELLESLDGLQGIENAHSVIVRWTGIKNCFGLNNLRVVEDILAIERNPNLVDLSGLENFYRASWGVFIAGNPQLISISALTGLSEDTEIYEYDNPLLEVDED